MPEVEDEEKDDSSRAAGEGPFPSPLLFVVPLLPAILPWSSIYIPADTARCSCFYHYCYYNFGGWTSNAKTLGLGEIRAGGERHDPTVERGERKKDRTVRSGRKRCGPSGEDKMLKKRKKKWLPSEGRTARKEEGFHRGFRGWPPGNL